MSTRYIKRMEDMVKSILKTNTLIFPLEEKVANEITPNKAHQLIEVAQVAMKDYMEGDEGDSFSQMYFHYSELLSLTATNLFDKEPQLSDTDAVAVVRKLLIVK